MKKKSLNTVAAKSCLFVNAFLCLLLLCLQFIHIVSPWQGLLAKQVQLNYDVQGGCQEKGSEDEGKEGRKKTKETQKC